MRSAPGSNAGCCGTARHSTDFWTSHMPLWSTSSFDGCGPRAGTPRGSLVLGQGRTWIDRRARVSPDGRAAACRRGEVGGSGSAGDARDGRPQDAPGERDRTRAGMAAGARGRLLVLREDWTARRRVAAHEATFAGAFPARGWAVRRWLRDPGVGADAAVAPGRPTPAGPPTSRGDLAAFSGLIFLTGAPQAGARHRVAVHSPGRRAANSPSGHLEHA